MLLQASQWPHLVLCMHSIGFGFWWSRRPSLVARGRTESEELPHEAFTRCVNLAIAGLQVGAKKVASEEETWSKLSNLIFYNNWKGIYSQLLPFAQLSKNSSLVDSLIPTFDAAFKCLPVTTKDVWSQVRHNFFLIFLIFFLHGYAWISGHAG